MTQGLSSPSGTARISDELIVKRNPDMIIAVPHGNPGDIDRLAAYMRDNPSWRSRRPRATSASTSRLATRCCRPTPTSRRPSATSARSSCTTRCVDPRATRCVRRRDATRARRRGGVASLTLGAVHVPLHDVPSALTGQADDGPLKQIVLELRLPRTVLAIVVGAALGVAGALLQGALANPLASPDVIGVTGGAGFGAILTLLVFPSAIALLPVGALVFGAGRAAIVFTIAWSGPTAAASARVILAGIAISALFGAATMSLMVAYSDRVQSAVFWLAGGLSSEGWSDLRVVALLRCRLPARRALDPPA